MDAAARRVWPYPKRPGGLYRARKWLSYGLAGLFAGPWLRLNGLPVLRLNLPARRVASSSVSTGRCVCGAADFFLKQAVNAGNPELVELGIEVLVFGRDGVLVPKGRFYTLSS